MSSVINPVFRTNDRGDKIYSWYYNYQLHRDGDLPAVIIYDKNDNITKMQWRQNNLFHRDGDKPALIAVENFDGKHELIFMAWYKNGLLHREDGPAIVYIDPEKSRLLGEEWFYDGLLHRENGPAKIYGKTKEFYILGTKTDGVESEEKTNHKKMVSELLILLEESRGFCKAEYIRQCQKENIDHGVRQPCHSDEKDNANIAFTLVTGCHTAGYAERHVETRVAATRSALEPTEMLRSASCHEGPVPEGSEESQDDKQRAMRQKVLEWKRKRAARSNCIQP